MKKNSQVRLCEFTKVELSVPRLKLIKLLLKRSYLTGDEIIFLKALRWKTESANNKILHVMSVIDKALLKSC
jgi:hypothetical protein